MPRQNRVTPLGELIADPARGLVYGNRGCLHDDNGRIRRTFDGKRWIACRLEFKDRRRPLMRPGRFTELFFLDEATAFAAGHRPCAECRREDYNRFTAIWREIHGGPSGADAMDTRLHDERLDHARARRLHNAGSRRPPDGTFVLRKKAPWLVVGNEIARWTPSGYTERRPATTEPLRVITPPSLVEVLRAGWEGVVPLLHSSARTAR